MCNIYIIHDHDTARVSGYSKMSICNTFTPQIKGAARATFRNVAGLQLGSDYIDVDAEIDCGD